jgi:hypothetical protein
LVSVLLCLGLVVGYEGPEGGAVAGGLILVE